MKFEMRSQPEPPFISFNFRQTVIHSSNECNMQGVPLEILPDPLLPNLEKLAISIYTSRTVDGWLVKEVFYIYDRCSVCSTHPGECEEVIDEFSECTDWRVMVLYSRAGKGRAPHGILSHPRVFRQEDILYLRDRTRKDLH